ncbi:MAG: hypothetical protein N4A40_09950 [Tissierellales bacterium]|jgi:hypothetical protein|nr:hypothetical protein [Tissierellales bacterium]
MEIKFNYIEEVTGVNVYRYKAQFDENLLMKNINKKTNSNYTYEEFLKTDNSHQEIFDTLNEMNVEMDNYFMDDDIVVMTTYVEAV